MRKSSLRNGMHHYAEHELLEMLRDEGEEKTFAYIRSLLKERRHG